MLSPVKLWRNQKNIQPLLGAEGEVVSYTIIRVPPEGFSFIAPYPVVLVVLSSGKRVMVQMADWDGENIVFGQRVVLILRRMSEPLDGQVIPYGIKAKAL